MQVLKKTKHLSILKIQHEYKDINFKSHGI